MGCRSTIDIYHHLRCPRYLTTRASLGKGYSRSSVTCFYLLFVLLLLINSFTEAVPTKRKTNSLRNARSPMNSGTEQKFPHLGLPSFDPYVERIKELHGASSATGAARVVRYYRLHNRCSGRHLNITGKRVTALASMNDRHALLKVETDSFESRVRISSVSSDKYLCFNMKGKLTAKRTGKNRRCVFHERMSANHYTEFHSAFNPEWKIGFNRKGRSLPGDRWKFEPQRPGSPGKCYQFLKRDYESVAVPETGGESRRHGMGRHDRWRGEGRMEDLSSQVAAQSGGGPWSERVDYKEVHARLLSMKKNSDV